MSKDYSTKSDQKSRWGGLLENPWVSKVQRRCLDGFNVQGLKRIVADLPYRSILDVGCGIGEYAKLRTAGYVGLDNSFPHIQFARATQGGCTFIHGDALSLPFGARTFDAVLLACATHHFEEEALLALLKEMARVSRKYIFIDDAVRWPEQSRLSRYFYDLDRGTQFRTIEALETILKKIAGFRLIRTDTHTTFPGLYQHAVFVLEAE